jgi:hypothetical protein
MEGVNAVILISYLVICFTAILCVASVVTLYLRKQEIKKNNGETGHHHLGTHFKK